MSKIRDLMGATVVAPIYDARLDMTIVELKTHILKMSYLDLLLSWKHAPKNDPFFVNEIGVFFKKVLDYKRELLSEEELAKINKLAGKGRYKGI